MPARRAFRRTRTARSDRPGCPRSGGGMILQPLVPGRIGDARRSKARAPQAAGVAAAARPALGIRLIARYGLAVIDAEPRAREDDLGLGPADERCVDAAGSAFDTGPGCERGQPPERFDELWTTVRVAAGVDDIDADKHIARTEHLHPGQRERQQDGVARRDVRDGNTLARALRHRDGAIGERRAANAGEIDAHDAMLAGAAGARDTASSVELRRVPLAIIDRERVAGEAPLERDRERRGRIEASR